MRRLRKSVKKKIIIGILAVVLQCLLIVLCQSVAVYVSEQKYRAVLKETEGRIKVAERTGYVTLREVRTGERFSEENVEKRQFLSEQNPEALATVVVGSIACADLREGELVTKSVCTNKEVLPSERKCVFYQIDHTEKFEEYDVVDVRIRYANGENYCVLKKKSLHKLPEDTEVCFFFLTEEEQLLMSAAQYDAEVYEGARLYLVGFREERLQEDAVSTYLPTLQVISQLCTWETGYVSEQEEWCRLRRELEERLTRYIEQRREGVL